MRVGIIGYGSIGRKHKTAIKNRFPLAEIYALRRHSDAPIETDIKSIFNFDELGELNLDFIIISNPTFAHEETINRLIPLQCPLFIEKPSIHSLENANDLLHRLENHSILTYTACNLRFLDCLNFLKKRIKKDAFRIHEINVYAGSYLPDWRNNRDFRKQYSAVKKLGGGVHFDLIHELDYLYWIFGAPLEVQSLLRSKSSLEIDSVDYANYNLIYKDFVINVILNYYRADQKRTIEIVFDGFTWMIDLLTNEIRSNDGTIVFNSNQKIIDTYFDQIEYMVDLIHSRASESMNSFKNSIDVLKMALANE